MPFAAGLSSHPVTALAAGEVIGSVLEQIGPHADVLVVGATPGHAGALEDVAAAVRAVLEPAVLIGAVARRLGDGAGARTEPALGLWGGSCGPAAAVRIEPGGGPAAPGRRGTAVLWAADAPGDDRLAGLGTVAGGVTAAPLLLEDRILRGGAVGLVTGRPDVRVVEVARPLRLLGPEAQVGAAEDRVVHELGGLPAMDGLLRMLRDVPPDDYRPEDLRLSIAGTQRAVTVLGTVTGTRSLVLDGELPAGALVLLVVPDRSRSEPVDLDGAQAVLAFGDAGLAADGAFPVATLAFEAVAPVAAGDGGAARGCWAATAALFPGP